MENKCKLCGDEFNNFLPNGFCIKCSHYINSKFNKPYKRMNKNKSFANNLLNSLNKENNLI